MNEWPLVSRSEHLLLISRVHGTQAYQHRPPHIALLTGPGGSESTELSIKSINSCINEADSVMLDSACHHSSATCFGSYNEWWFAHADFSNVSRLWHCCGSDSGAWFRSLVQGAVQGQNNALAQLLALC
jgi:hypothetical protein